jgi:hypothetical protein
MRVSQHKNKNQNFCNKVKKLIQEPEIISKFEPVKVEPISVKQLD